MTANWGLKFNRAALFLTRPEDPTVLLGMGGIGPLDDKDKREIWGAIASGAPASFEAYRHGSASATFNDPVHRAVTAARITLRPDRSDAVSRLLDEKTPQIVESVDLPSLGDLRTCLLPTTEVLLVPLNGPGGSAGLVVVDNKFSRAPITPLAQELVWAFGSMAVLAMGAAGTPAPSGIGMTDLPGILKEFRPQFGRRREERAPARSGQLMRPE